MIVKPFRAIRYKTDLKNMVSPPYDTIDYNLKMKLESKCSYNIVRLILPEGENRYENAGKLFHKWIDEKVLLQDNDRSIYPYQSFYKINDTVKSMKGILAIFKLSEFKKGVIMPHEKTFSAPKADRLNLIKACSANLSPVLGLYKSSKNAAIDFDAVIRNSVMLDEFSTDDGIGHRFYSLSDTDLIKQSMDILKNYSVIIGDGHHRYETALNYQKFMTQNGGSAVNGHNWILMFLVDMSGDNISLLSINRMINGINLNKFKAAASDFFDFSEPVHFNDNHNALFVTDGKRSYTVTAKRKAVRFLDNLDISDVEKKIPTVIVDKLIADFLLKDKGVKVEHYGDDKNVKIEENSVFIKLHPVKYEIIEDAVNNNYTMPQKSTFFYPKVPTGLVINRLDQDV